MVNREMSCRLHLLFGVLVACLAAACQGFTVPPCSHRIASCCQTPTTGRLVLSSNKNDGNDDDDKKKKVYQDEEEASRKVFDSLSTGQGFDSAIFAFGIGFLVFGFLLNILGYDYVVKDGRLTIDTIEARQFQTEVNKAMKAQKRENAPPSAINSVDVPPAASLLLEAPPPQE
ncbi:expressed unknown protein [Seminavis robusta]|uniref:Uncharacterized protein n=1 Tax=Seminavis robusta TaxID=568900 RepID=A0A9N8HAV7_9STRA|nr:expressed unknown protein [Seminavis robusta]|eukprot:Sro161_g072580.1 n/a (173) ;mRNA; r:72718-73236